MHWAFDQATADCEVARCDDAAAHDGNQSGFSVVYNNTWVVSQPVPTGADLIFAVYVNPTNAPSLSFSAPSVCAYQSAKVSGYLKDVGAKPLEGKPIRSSTLRRDRGRPQRRSTPTPRVTTAPR